MIVFSLSIICRNTKLLGAGKKAFSSTAMTQARHPSVGMGVGAETLFLCEDMASNTHLSLRHTYRVSCEDTTQSPLKQQEQDSDGGGKDKILSLIVNVC